ncbi:MAG: Holliday junction resolvase RuvX [Pseudomonadota bacterium]
MKRNEDTSLEQLSEILQAHQRLLGLDLGTKTIGLALSDVNRTIATPMETLKRTKLQKNAEQLLDIVEEHNIGGFILGYPMNMDGSDGPRAQSTRAFLRNLSEITKIPIVLWDERLSTIAAERVLLDADRSRKRRAEVIDKMAAAYILQGALDRLRVPFLRPPK